jgi:hypothetical protein
MYELGVIRQLDAEGTNFPIAPRLGPDAEWPIPVVSVMA